MHPILHSLLMTVATILLFALYFFSVVNVYTQREELQAFVGTFDPLSVFFTALAFFGLVLGWWHQARELNETKVQLGQERNERIEALIHVTRLQAAGLRLLSMSIERDVNSQKALQELETMVAQFEQRFVALIK